MHDTGLDSRRTGLLVNPQDLVVVLGGVEDDAWADRIAGDRSAGTSHGDRRPMLTSDAQSGGNLGIVTRSYDDLWRDAIEPSVAGVERLGQGTVVDIGNPLSTQCLS